MLCSQVFLQAEKLGWGKLGECMVKAQISWPGWEVGTCAEPPSRSCLQRKVAQRPRAELGGWGPHWEGFGSWEGCNHTPHPS